jgi:hypothetical protein
VIEWGRGVFDAFQDDYVTKQILAWFDT